MRNNTLAIALAALLVGGVATAAFMNNRAPQSQYGAGPTADAAALGTGADALVDDSAIPASGRVEYANVVDVDPITEKEQLYATVIGTDAVRETSTTSTPREVCEDVVVQERAPERDGNVGGTVAGAVIGGLVGYNVTYRNPDGTTGTMRTDSKPGNRIALGTEDKVIGYDVTYRYDGREHTIRMDEKPGDRLPVIDGQVVTQVAAVGEEPTTRQ